MNLYYSKMYMSDLDYVIEHAEDVLNGFRNKSVLIIGARGLVCSAIADILFRYNEKKDANTHLYLAGRSIEALKERFSKYSKSKDCDFISFDSNISGDLIGKLPDDISYIIDGIGPSAPGDIKAYPVDSLCNNVLLLKDLLTYADSRHSLGMLYISSSEIYGTSKKGGPFKEDDYGYVDILNPRSSYSSGKRACENLCACFAGAVRTIIARPGHVYGPTARMDDDHIATSFAYEAAMGHDLKMNTEGLQLRSYCYMLDCASAMLTILIRGKSGDAYNISNPESVLTLRNMMDYIARAGNVSLTVGNTDGHIHDHKMDNPMPDSSLVSDKLIKLGWKGLFNACDGADHTIRIIKQSMILP